MYGKEGRMRRRITRRKERTYPQASDAGAPPAIIRSGRRRSCLVARH